MIGRDRRSKSLAGLEKGHVKKYFIVRQKRRGELEHPQFLSAASGIESHVADVCARRHCGWIETMLEAKITKTGRGPEIAGTRITVYDVLEYEQTGWHRDMIAAILSLSSQQVEAAIQYIGEHRAEVMASYEHNMERIRRGNPPEVQAKHEVRTSGSKPGSASSAWPKMGGRRMRGILADINVGRKFGLFLPSGHPTPGAISGTISDCPS